MNKNNLKIIHQIKRENGQETQEMEEMMCHLRSHSFAIQASYKRRERGEKSQKEEREERRKREREERRKREKEERKGERRKRKRGRDKERKEI